MNSTELKPCPFCGGEVTAYADKYNKVMISCDKCKMYFGIELEIGCELEDGWKATYNSKEDAIRNWNTRKPMDNIMAELEDKQLSSISAHTETTIGMCGTSAAYYSGEISGYNNAIDIVKAGGVK